MSKKISKKDIATLLFEGANFKEKNWLQKYHEKEEKRIGEAFERVWKKMHEKRRKNGRR